MKIPTHLIPHSYEEELSREGSSSQDETNHNQRHHNLYTFISPRPDIHEMIERTHIEEINAFNVGRNTVELIKNDQNQLEVYDNENEIKDEEDEDCSSEVLENPSEADLFLNIVKTPSNQSKLESIEIISDGELQRNTTTSTNNDFTVSLSPSTATFSFQPTIEENPNEHEGSSVFNQKKLATSFFPTVPKREIYGIMLPNELTSSIPNQEESNHKEEEVEKMSPSTPPNLVNLKFATPKDRIFDVSTKMDHTVSPVTPMSISLTTPTKTTHLYLTNGQEIPKSILARNIVGQSTSHYEKLPLLDPIEFSTEKHSPNTDEELVSFIVSKNKLLSHHQKWLETLSSLPPLLPLVQTFNGDEAGLNRKNYKHVFQLKRITNIEDTLDDEDNEEECRNNSSQKISPYFDSQEKCIQFMHPGKKKHLKDLFHKNITTSNNNNNNNKSTLNHSSVTLTPNIRTESSLISLNSPVLLTLESNKLDQNKHTCRSPTHTIHHKSSDSPSSIPLLYSPNQSMVSRKISSSSGRTASSKDTMIEVLGKPETTDSSYNSSREFIPTRAPPPPKINNYHNAHHDADIEENGSSSQSSKISKQEKFQEFSKKLFKKSSQSSFEAKSLYEKLIRKEKKRHRDNHLGVDKNIQTDDITNTLTLEMHDIKKKREKQYKEDVTLSLKSFLDAKSLNNVVDSFKDYVERSLI